MLLRVCLVGVLVLAAIGERSAFSFQPSTGIRASSRRGSSWSGKGAAPWELLRSTPSPPSRTMFGAGGAEGAEGASDGSKGDDIDVSKLEKLKVYNAKKNHRLRDNRDSLPYHVSIVSPPPRSLGVFALDPNTQSGDLIEHESKHYEVQRVRCLYRYRSGLGYVMTKKMAEAIDFNRIVEEAFLNRVIKLSEPARGNAKSWLEAEEQKQKTEALSQDTDTDTDTNTDGATEP